MLKTIITAAALASLASMVMLAQGPASALGAAAPQSNQTLLNPPAWVFRLPDRVLGTVEHVHGLTIIHPRGMDASSVALYRWAAAPSINAALTRDYLAQQAVRSGCVGPGSGCAPGIGMPRPSIVRYPAGGWLYGRYSAPSGSGGRGHYAYSAGAVFHNLTFRVDAWCALPKAKDPAQDGCAAWTAQTLAHLLGRARGYAAQHPHGDPLRSRE